MSRGQVVIVGAGQGGLQAAASLRQSGFAGRIALIGAEPGLPYQRPPLSKAFLADGRAEALTLRPQSFFEAKEIDYRPETEVLRIDRAAARVELSGPGGEEALPYDHLILATGTRTARPPVEGLEHAMDMRTLADAVRLRGRMAGAPRFAVIGGGFIGLEFAAVARKAGLEVDVIEVAPRLMARAVSKAMSEDFAGWHRAAGARLHLGQPAAMVDPAGVTLADGSRVEADVVLLAAGVRPATELARDAGLEIENGIKVDAQLLTSDPAISALGDCASFPDPRTGARIRLESVQAATDHARLIAARLSGRTPGAYAALPWFWSDQGSRKLQIAGFAAPGAMEEILCEGVVARIDEHGVTAVETVDRPAIHMRARKLMAGHAPLGLAALKDAVLLKEARTA